MLRLTLAQMRHSTGRLVAAGLAIVLGTAFIAATLLGSGIMRDTTYAAMTASIGHADVVVDSFEEPITPAQLADVRDLSGVSVADGDLGLFASLIADGRQDWSPVKAVAPPGLIGNELIGGDLPTATGQLAVSASTADRLGLEIGDPVAVGVESLLPPTEGTGAAPPVIAGELTITGILEDASALVGPPATALVSVAQRDAWVAESGQDLAFTQLLVAADDSPAVVAEEIRGALPATFVQTGEEYAEGLTEGFTGTTYTFTALILAFGALAMFVAAIVITNTFQVIVAQRTHTLALLRATGATTGQIRRSVLVEALMLGTLAGTAGLLLGIGLAQGALWLLSGQDLGLPLPGAVPITPAVVLVPILTGAVVTWLAALSPARAATAVSPLAALRPPQPPDPRGASRLRAVASLLLVVLGAALLAGGVLLARAALDPDVSADIAILGGLGLGVAGGVVSFAGVMLGVVFIAPGLVRLLGSVVARLGGGMPVRIATANATRHPRRTAATATALVIGVTLVTLMSTGAVSARASLDQLLRGQFPVDLVARTTAWDSEGQRALTPAQLETVRSTDGVADTLEIRQTEATLTEPAPVGAIALTGFDPDSAREVLLESAMVADVAPGTVVMGDQYVRGWGLATGDTIGLESSSGPTVELDVVVTTERLEALVTPEDLARIDPEAPVTQLWAQLDEGPDHASVIAEVQDRLTEAQVVRGPADPQAPAATPYVEGPAAERAAFEQVINTLLAIVVGLLVVAVVIALIGVANTLSLSVIERRRESALLRAMGLTRRQLRTMLAVEGVFLALVGVLIGAVLGVLYGWAGTAVTLGLADELVLAVPWLHLAAIILVAVLAGLAASVLPARNAARTPPVAALAAE